MDGDLVALSPRLALVVLGIGALAMTLLIATFVVAAVLFVWPQLALQSSNRRLARMLAGSFVAGMVATFATLAAVAVWALGGAS